MWTHPTVLAIFVELHDLDFAFSLYRCHVCREIWTSVGEVANETWREIYSAGEATSESSTRAEQTQARLILELEIFFDNLVSSHLARMYRIVARRPGTNHGPWSRADGVAVILNI